MMKQAKVKDMPMSKKTHSILENLVIVMIILVIIQTFLEDFFTAVGLGWNLRKVLVFTGVGFDIFFTVEFLVRLYVAMYRKKTAEYILRRRGWIDFFASIPLLLLNSGPSALALLAGGGGAFAVAGVLNVLKIVKAVRIARILRLLRVLKIFKQIKYADSPMAQRHIAQITSITITTFVGVLFIFNAVSSLGSVPSIDSLSSEYRSTLTGLIALRGDKPEVRSLVEGKPDILVIKSGGATVFSRFDNRYYRHNFGPMDYSYVNQDGLEVFFDIRAYNAASARESLAYFVIIIALTIVFLLYYSPHFAITVSDPIHVMVRGMTEKNYNLEVKELPRYAQDDVFLLAKAYNEKFLPLKGLMENQSQMESDIQIDDLDDLFRGL